MSPEGLSHLKKLKAHEHYLNSKSKKREANPVGRRPTNKLHHNNYNVDNLNQDINNDATPTTHHDNSNNDGDYTNSNNNNSNSDKNINDNNDSSINNDNDNDNNEKGTTDDNTVSFKLDEILVETHN